MKLPSRFPDPETADPQGCGLVAVGGYLSPELLIDAYAHGIFPWPCDEDSPLMWYSLDPRMVLLPERFRYSKSLRRVVESGRFEVCVDTCFEDVIRSCAAVKREGQDGTWITEAMVEAYCRLHRMGVAHSFETLCDGRLVGGLYGVSLGRFFCGESMFHTVRDASKVAFVKLVEYSLMHGFRFIDAQQPTRHLSSLGAEPMPRKEYLKMLDDNLVIQNQSNQSNRNNQSILKLQSFKSHSVALSLGGNQGDVRRSIGEALRLLGEVLGPLTACSRFYESEPWGFDHPVPNFLNVCAVFDTDLSPHEVLEAAMQIEKRLGRQRTAVSSQQSAVSGQQLAVSSQQSAVGRGWNTRVPLKHSNIQALKHSHYSSRPIDIDILFYDNRVIDCPDLQVPHPRMHLRRFVLQPLAELMPQFVHPVLKLRIAELLSVCPDRGVVKKCPATTGNKPKKMKSDI